jgi:hypothetical protein
MRIIQAVVILLSLSSCAFLNKGPDDEIVRGFEVFPAQTLLIVKVESAEFTGLYPYDCPKEECIPFHFWFKYEAEVLDVVEGEFSASEISFAALHHTYYIEEVTDEWYILIEKFNEEDSLELGVQYRVIEHDSRAFHSE